MSKVTYTMGGVSLDGYIAGPDGKFDWSAPDSQIFRFHLEETRGLAGHLLGRRLYETMLYWETAGTDPRADDDERDFAELWQALPKVVFSRTLTSVKGTNTRLAQTDLATEIRSLQAGASGDVAIGGAELAAEAARQGLIDEYGLVIHPVSVGGGTPYLPKDQHLDLELVETRTFGSRAIYLRYCAAGH